MSTMDEQRGIVTTTTYRQDFPFTGMPVSTTQTYYGASDLSWDNLSGGTVFSSATNEYRTETIQRTNSDRITHFPYLYRSVENQYVVQSSGSVTQTGTLVTTNEYQKFNNNHFNLTRSCVQHHNGEFIGVSGDGCGAGISGSLIKAVITSNSYNLSGADLSEEQGSLTDWTLGRLRSTSVSHTTSAGTDTRHSRFEYITGTADPLRGLLKREIIAPDSTDETLNLTTLHCYDSVGNKTGVVTHSNHYSDVNSCSVSKPLSDNPYQVFRRQTTTYDAAKRYVLSTANDKQTLQTFSGHNRFGQPELVTDINGVTTTWWYDAFGSAFATQKSTGERQLTERRRKAHISQMGVPAVISDFYFAEKISSTNPQGEKAAPDALKFYDKLGRTVATARAGFEADTWYVTLSSYDVFGRQVSTTEPYTWQLSGSEPKRRHYINYDWQGRPVKSTDVSGVVTQITYSTAAHQLTTRTTLTSDTKTQVRTSTSNLLGQTVQVIDDVGAENATIHYTYTPTGKLHTAGVGNNIVTTDHDAYGRKTGMQDKNKGNWDYSYNALGELVTQTKLGQNGNTQNNIVTTFTRDTLGRTTERQVTENGSTERTLYQFDGTHIHQLKTQCFAQGSTGTGCDTTKPVKTFAYDSAGRAHQMTTTINDGTTSHSLTTATTFDTFGRVFQQFDDNDQHYGLRFHYNAQGYQYMQEEARYSNDCQAATNTALNGCANIVYSRVTATNAYGKALSVEQNNGIVTTTNRYDRRTGLLTDRAVRSDNTLIQYNEYQYNDLGNMTLRRRNSLNQTDNANTGAVRAMAHYQDSDLTIAQSLALNTQKFGYDNLNRLTALNGKNWISYDAQGNITHKADVGHYCYDAARPNAVSKTSKTDSSCHNEASYTYDDWGNQTTGRGRTIDYGHFDKAVSITKDSKTTTFAYDTGRNRYQRITDLDGTKQERTLYFGSQERIYERDSSSAPWTLTKTRRNLPGAIQTVYPTGAEDTHFQHKDNLGSVNTVTNENGRIVQKMYFDPWGKKFMLPETMWTDTARNMQAPTLAGILDITPRGFTGHEHVDHADIIHMNGRIYDPTLGRFLQADPFIQAPNNSQSYNRYSYLMNNPLGGTDPSGYIGKFFRKLVGVLTNGIVGEALASIVPELRILSNIVGCAFGNIYQCGAIVAGNAFAGGASVGDSIKAGVFAGISAAAFSAVGKEFVATDGFWANGGLGHIGAHAVTGGVMAELQGGKFGHGFVSAGLSKALGPTYKGIGGDTFMIDNINVAEVVVAGTIGGTISKITGGKFANGAVSAAMGNLFNEQDALKVKSKSDLELGKEALDKLIKQNGLRKSDIIDAERYLKLDMSQEEFLELFPQFKGQSTLAVNMQMDILRRAFNRVAGFKASKELGLSYGEQVVKTGVSAAGGAGILSQIADYLGFGVSELNTIKIDSKTIIKTFGDGYYSYGKK